MNHPKEKGYSSILSFAFSLAFLGLAALAAYLVIQYQGAEHLLEEITFWQFIVIALAAFRLTRLLTYDAIFQFGRDLFLDKKITKKEGRVYVLRTKPPYHPLGIRRLFADLLDCPWCTGVWVSLVVMFAFYITPYSWPFLILLAVAGVSSFIQISINCIGWQAEHTKLICDDFECRIVKD